MKDIRFGIIGCGDVTEKKSGPAFKKVQGSDLVMVMRRNEEKLKDYAKRHHISKYTTDYEELLADDKVDAIYIATPPKWHHYYVLEAAKYKKPIYVEKPMALTVTECEEIMKACEENEVPLYVAYYRRGQEKFKYIKKLLDNNELGEVRSFHFDYSSQVPEINPERSWLLSKEEAGGGLLYDIGSHMIDIILYFFGNVKTAKGMSNNQSKIYDVNDVTSGIICFENGIQGSVQMTFNGCLNEDKLVIIGTKGYAELSIMSNDPISITIDGKKTSVKFDDLEHVQQPYIQMVVDSLQGLNDMDNTGLEGVNTQKVLQRFNKTLKDS